MVSNIIPADMVIDLESLAAPTGPNALDGVAGYIGPVKAQEAIRIHTSSDPVFAELDAISMTWLTENSFRGIESYLNFFGKAQREEDFSDQVSQRISGVLLVLSWHRKTVIIIIVIITLRSSI